LEQGDKMSKSIATRIREHCRNKKYSDSLNDYTEYLRKFSRIATNDNSLNPETYFYINPETGSIYNYFESIDTPINCDNFTLWLEKHFLVTDKRAAKHLYDLLKIHLYNSAVTHKFPYLFYKYLHRQYAKNNTPYGYHYYVSNNLFLYDNKLCCFNLPGDEFRYRLITNDIFDYILKSNNMSRMLLDIKRKVIRVYKNSCRLKLTLYENHELAQDKIPYLMHSLPDNRAFDFLLMYNKNQTLDFKMLANVQDSFKSCDILSGFNSGSENIAKQHDTISHFIENDKSSFDALSSALASSHTCSFISTEVAHVCTA